MLKKSRAALNKYIIFFISFSPKIDENLSLKVRKTMFSRKSDKKSHPFGPRLDFWSIFGSRREPKNPQKVTGMLE